MNNYHELKLKDNPFMWAYEEFQRDHSYWLDRAKNGEGLIKEIALFVLRNGKPQPEGDYAMAFGIEAPHRSVACKREITKVREVLKVE